MQSKSKNRPTRKEFYARQELMFNDISEKISSNQWSFGTFLPSELNLSDNYSLSRSSARNVLSRLEEHGIITKVRGKGIIAGNISKDSGKKSSVGILLPRACIYRGERHLDETPQARPELIFDVIESYLLESGKNIKVLIEGDSSVDFAVEELIEDGISSLIIIDESSTYMRKLAEKARQFNISVIIAGVSHSSLPTVSHITYENYYIGVLAVKHLLGQGFEEIACIAAHSDYPWVKDRINGYRDTCIEAGLGCHEEYLIDLHSSISTPHKWLQAGFEGAQALFNKNHSSPIAIFCINDFIAEGVFKYAGENGLKILKDFAIIGCDDNHKFFNLNLTTIKVNYLHLAKETASLVEKYLSGKYNNSKPIHIKIAPTLIPKQTTAKQNHIIDEEK